MTEPDRQSFAPIAFADPEAEPTAAEAWQQALGEDYETFRDLVETKGWRGPEDALQSYRELERRLGSGERLSKPRADAEPAAWDAFYRALGRPERPEDYEFSVPTDFGDYAQDLAADFAATAHAAGLSGEQARRLHDWWVERAQAAASDPAALESELDRRWGAEKERRLDLARRAARHFGFQGEQIDRLSVALGDLGTVEGFARMGEALAEDRITEVNGGGATGPSAAKAELERAMTDDAFRRALFDRGHPGHAAAVARFRRLSLQTDPTAVVRPQG